MENRDRSDLTLCKMGEVDTNYLETSVKSETEIVSLKNPFPQLCGRASVSFDFNFNLFCTRLTAAQGMVAHIHSL